MDLSIGELVRVGIDRLRAAGTERPRLDAELLLGHVTGLERTAIVAHPEATVGAEARGRFEADLARRERGEPVAYIRGVKEFYGLVFHVDHRALIPRPETELLVELAERLAVERLALERPAGSKLPAPVGAEPLRIVDVGTGSGAVPIALAALLRRRGLLEPGLPGWVEILATDQSADALALAGENLATHDLAGSIRLVDADLLPPGAGPFDLVVANLPYIPSADVPGLPVAASFEPRSALDGGPDGLTIIRRLLARLPAALAEGGVALLEIGGDQGDLIRVAVADLLPGWICEVVRDLSGLPRVARVERGSGEHRREERGPVARRPSPEVVA